jgi:formamidopyrimidine-DNA glycosylase
VPELPDVTVYVEHLQRRLVGRTLQNVRLLNPFVLRTAVPPLASAHGRKVSDVKRLGKRMLMALEGSLFIVIHLMVAGRLRWLQGQARTPARSLLAAFDFEHGSLALTEAGTRRRASIHLVQGEAALAQMDPGGLEVPAIELARFAAQLRKENHTLKRALTDPRLFSGIGNAYSDEILHRARLSPLALTRSLQDDEVARLHQATQTVLRDWTERLRAASGEVFPEKVTAFRDGMAVHGRYRQPCPVCGSPVQRIVYAENEAHYCARCQTGGRILADRALSRLLKKSWPRSIDDVE